MKGMSVRPGIAGSAFMDRLDLSPDLGNSVFDTRLKPRWWSAACPPLGWGAGVSDIESVERHSSVG